MRDKAKRKKPMRKKVERSCVVERMGAAGEESEDGKNKAGKALMRERRGNRKADMEREHCRNQTWNAEESTDGWKYGKLYTRYTLDPRGGLGVSCPSWSGLKTRRADEKWNKGNEQERKELGRT